MMRGGASDAVALLDDPRNDVRPTAEELNSNSEWTGGRTRQMVRYLLEVAMLHSSQLRGWGRVLARRAVEHRRPQGIRSVVRWLYRLELHAAERYRLRNARRELADFF